MTTRAQNIRVGWAQSSHHSSASRVPLRSASRQEDTCYSISNDTWIVCGPDVALLDEDAGVVDGFGQAELEDQGLQAALQEVLGGQGQHIIQLVLPLLQQPVLVHAPQQGLALKQPCGVLVVPRQQRPCCLPDPAGPTQTTIRCWST